MMKDRNEIGNFWCPWLWNKPDAASAATYYSRLLVDRIVFWELRWTTKSQT